jgi:hypothetical protein
MFEVRCQPIAEPLDDLCRSSRRPIAGPSFGIHGPLIGGVDATGRVDAADVSLVRQQTLRSATRSNFREDVNTSGRVDAADVSHRPAANVDLLNGAAGAATSEASGWAK